MRTHARSRSLKLSQLAVGAAALVLLSTGCAGPADDPSAEDAAAADAVADTAPDSPADGAGSAPAPAPAPTVRTVTLQPGAQVSISLSQDVSSGIALVGDPVVGTVTQPVSTDGQVMIPAAAQVRGTVIEVKPAKRFGGQAMVGLQFDSIVLPDGETVAVEGTLAAYAKKETAKDAGIIAGGTAGGALLGKAIGGDDKDAGLGAVVGGAIGTAVASRKGDEAFLPVGSESTVVTVAPLRRTARL